MTGRAQALLQAWRAAGETLCDYCCPRWLPSATAGWSALTGAQCGLQALSEHAAWPRAAAAHPGPPRSSIAPSLTARALHADLAGLDLDLHPIGDGQSALCDELLHLAAALALLHYPRGRWRPGPATSAGHASLLPLLRFWPLSAVRCDWPLHRVLLLFDTNFRSRSMMAACSAAQSSPCRLMSTCSRRSSGGG